MRSNRSSFLKGILLGLICFGVFLAIPFSLGVENVFAQALTADELFGGEGASGETFAQSLGLAAGPPLQVIIARIIRTILGFAGVVLVVMIIYGGFLWMTAGGNATRLEKAKKILTQSIIGMIIVLSSFAIVQFVISKLVDATGGGVTGDEDGGGGTYPDNDKFTSFSLSSVNTECAASLRNLQLQFVFTKAVNASTVEEAIAVNTVGGNAVEGTFVTKGSKVTFTPAASCPEPNPNAKCFEANTDFEISINASLLKSTSGASLQCTAGGVPCGKIPFTTGSAVDTSGPAIAMSTPYSGQSVTVGTIELLQANTKDDVGVSSVDFYVIDDNEPLFVADADLYSTKGQLTGGNVDNAFFTDIIDEWDTAGYVTNKSYAVWASASDCAGNAATATKVYPIVRAAHCDNNEIDEEFGETGLNCGGDPASPEYCGKCSGDACTENNECASGVCEGGVCVSKPRIDLVSPGDGAVGNLVTIGGKGFGAQGGTVTFIGTEGTQSVQVQAYQCNGETKWSEKEIVVQLPSGATDGPIEVTAQDGKKDRTDDEFGPLSADFDVNAVKRPGLCSVSPASGVQGSETTFSGLSFGAQKGTSSVFFKNFLSPSTTSWAEAQIKAIVPNMSAGQVLSQVFTGDYQCIDAAGNSLGKTCQQNSDCGEGNSCATNWCTETLAFCSTDADCGETGGNCTSIRVGSNKLLFTVTDPAGSQQAPTISYVDTGWKACNGGPNNAKVCAKDEDCAGSSCASVPNWGPVGQYVTIFGTNFGTNKGTVHFTGGLGQDAVGDTNFPAQCAEGFWTDTSVTVKVPSVFQTNESLKPGTYQLTVKQTGGVSNAVEFVVVDGVPGPQICKLDPISGPADAEVDVYGENLGIDEGHVTFFNTQDAGYKIWTGTKITDAVVPGQAQSGPLNVFNALGFGSNSLNFTVGSCPKDVSCPVGFQCCGDGTCKAQCDLPPPQSHFAYRVSTGIIPENPTVIVACDKKIVSPSPSVSWPDSQTVCPNAAVTATFSKQMDQASVSKSVLVEQCTDVQENGCGSWTVTSGTMKTTEVSFIWTPNQAFAAGGQYRVTILGGNSGAHAHADAGGAPMLEDYSWQFAIGPQDQLCEVGSVLVSPFEFTAVEQNELVSYGALLVAKGKQCIVINPNESNIAWSTNFFGAQVKEPSVGMGLDAVDVEALEETPGNPAKVKAEVTNSPAQPSGTGELTIDFNDPTVEAFFPSCSTACINVKPWFRFKSDVLVSSLSGSILLRECKTALCAPEELTVANQFNGFGWNPSDKPGVVEKSTPISINLKNNLKPNTWYRVILDGEQILSASKVPLKDSGVNFGSEQNLYYPNDFSWKFKTKASDVTCGIDKVSVSPKTELKKAIGQRQAYLATAYGAPDDCDASGQALQDAGYTWQTWTATDTPDEFTAAEGGSSQDVAFLFENGAIKTASSVPLACTPACLNAGTLVKQSDAICGDGVVNGPGKVKSEECDGGQGCSAACLWQGTAVCEDAAGVGCCGNKKVEPGEQCDDGNTVGGDGCSASCLNNGSGSVGATCGDGVVDFALQTGGEDCDDGNTVSGDGCSSQCLFEGSVPKGDFAICGNGGAPEKGEDCDDGNSVSGDGCSAQCLHEGTAQCAYVCSDNQQSCKTNADCGAGATCGPAKTPCCGNGQKEAGEDCDDLNNLSGDGCSKQCLFEGSSLSYGTPSFCGNGGALETGEECEVSAGQTLAIGGFAAAEISLNAPKEVGLDGGTAYSTITASVEGVKSDPAMLGIDCSCNSDQSCGASTTLGCGTGSCCFQRPKLGAILPAIGDGPGGQGYCRNTAVSVEFDQKMDFGSAGVPEGAQLANVRLKLMSKDGKLISQNPSLCPASYQKIAHAGDASQNLFVRAWNWIKSLFRSSEAVAAPGDCYVPLTYTAANTQNGQRFDLNYQDLLEPNAVYHVEIVGDNNPNDSTLIGVLSENKVGLCLNPAGGTCGAVFSHNFKTSSEVCLLEAVTVVDHGKVVKQQYESLSPYFFSKKGETHGFESTAMTYRDGLGTFEPIQKTGAYDWTWAWGSSVADAKADENIISQKQNWTGYCEEGSKAGQNCSADGDCPGGSCSVLLASEALFEAVGLNGSEHAVATATISKDTFNNPTTQGTQTSGTAEVTALVCEKPWPPLNSALGFPYIEKTDPTKPSNFGFYYCMDKGVLGDTSDDLPELAPPVDVTSVGTAKKKFCSITNKPCSANADCSAGEQCIDVDGGLFQELLFKVQGTPDAIGVRVIQNPNYLSPETWFTLQGFMGAYQKMEMDGYQAIKSGNTAYVAAANEHGAKLYSNIYVVSYNPTAGAQAKEIFDQILTNWRFNANTDVITNVGLCKIGNAYKQDVAGEFIGCAWNGDCVDLIEENGVCSASKFPANAAAAGGTACPLDESKNAFCDSEKSKIQRDLHRLTDIVKMVSLLADYGAKNRHCSVTKNVSCTVSEQCPGNESCVEGYPTLQQGTFVPALSMSKWESWDAQFANELGAALPSDPLNAFWNACAKVGSGYDPATCFNGLEGKFVCPDKSHVYGYQSVGGETYKLFAQLEYGGAPWNDKIDQFPTDDATIIAEYGGNASAPGVLEAGFEAGTVKACVGGSENGKLCVKNADCPGGGFCVSTGKFCADNKVWGVSTICGDGVVAIGIEDCEPGQISTAACVDVSTKKSGLVNVTCLSSGPNACKYQTAPEALQAGAACVPYVCGNGVLDPGESCDDGAENGTYGHCGTSCKLDIASAKFCGDGYLSGAEQCDCGSVANFTSVHNNPKSWSNSNIYAKALCAVANGQYQATGSCSFDCKIPGPMCGDNEINGTEQCDGGTETWAGKLCSDGITTCVSDSDCPSGKKCGTGSTTNKACGSSKICEGGTKAGLVCTNNTQCPQGTCSSLKYDLTRQRSCNNSCNWPAWSACFGGEQFCGNGKLEGKEECDDGNQSNNDSCTNACKKNVCGDSHLYNGVESCDNGGNNVLPGAAVPCSAPYGTTCNYCNTQCQYKTYTGTYCGDGVINGNEYCDGTAMPKWCVKTSGGVVEKSKTCTANADCDSGFSCTNAGICNGGANNGKTCTSDASCPAAKCVLPVCASDCSAACPFTFKETSILVQSEQEGSEPQQSIDLYSYLNKEKLSPDNALLHLPACLVGSKITANVDNKDVIPPSVDVVFVTDLSGSMKSAPNGSSASAPNRRIDIVAEATAEAIDTLYNSYPTEGGKLRIGLVSFGGKAYPYAAQDDVKTVHPELNASLLENSGTNKQILKSIAKNYPSVFDGWTPTANGVQKAIEILEKSPTSNVKIVVLLSDGEPSYALGNQIACDTKKNVNIVTEDGTKTLSGSDYCTAETRYGPNLISKSQEKDSLIFFYSAAIATSDKLRAYMEHMSSMKCDGKSMTSLSDCNEGLYAFDADTKEEIKAMYDQIIKAILSATTTVTSTQNGVKSATAVTPVGNNVSIPIPTNFQCQSTAFTMPLRTTFYGTGAMKFDNFKFTYCPTQP